MTGRNRQPATYEDLIALPKNLLGQLIDGELHATPRPPLGHVKATSSLVGLVGLPFGNGLGKGPGGWLILHKPELHLGPDVLVPDLAGWQRTRMPTLPAATQPFLELAPDWICEVLSPSTVSLDRIRKMPIYAREQVQHAWLIDPVARTLEVYHLREGAWTLLSGFSGDERIRAEPFDAVELDLSALWLPEPPPDPAIP